MSWKWNEGKIPGTDVKVNTVTTDDGYTIHCVPMTGHPSEAKSINVKLAYGRSVEGFFTRESIKEMMELLITQARSREDMKIYYRGEDRKQMLLSWGYKEDMLVEIPADSYRWTTKTKKQIRMNKLFYFLIGFFLFTAIIYICGVAIDSNSHPGFYFNPMDWGTAMFFLLCCLSVGGGTFFGLVGVSISEDKPLF